MKFVCDQCKTKYSIDDARVRGKVLKIRCKQCNQIITVREETASRTGSSPSMPAQSRALEKALDASFGGGGADFADGAERTTISSGAAAAAAIAAATASAKPAVAAEDWFISFDGEQEGPLSLEKVVARIKVETPKGKEAHAWRDGFDGWLAIADVPEIQQAIKAAAAAARPATTGRSTGAVPKIPSDASRPAVRPAAAQVKPAVPAAAQRTPAPAAARPFAPSEPTVMEMQAPVIPAAKSAVVARSSPAAAVAAAPVPAIDTTPAPLPAPPLPAIEPAPPLAAIAQVPTAPIAAEKPRDESMTPLPPPPAQGHELVIGEPSAVMRIPSVPPNGQAAAAPVVIITGPGSHGAPWLKWALVGGGAVILLLLGTVGYLLFGRKPVAPLVVAAAPPVAAPAGTPVDDRPPAVVDPGSPAPAAPAPAAPVAKGDPKTPASPSKHSSGPRPGKPEKLSSSQADLQRLYGDADKTAPQRELPKVQEERRPQAQVSESQLREVVTRNRQALTFCYERVLKRDTSLKNARVDVEVHIGISGSVTKVNVGDTYTNTDIGNCLTQAIKRWHFPAQDSEYSTSFPLLLQAQ
jgi:predicted Zn finger-like uncharacterized protein